MVVHYTITETTDFSVDINPRKFIEFCDNEELDPRDEDSIATYIETSSEIDPYVHDTYASEPEISDADVFIEEVCDYLGDNDPELDFDE